MNTDFWIAVGSVGACLTFVIGLTALVREWWSRRTERQWEQALKVAAWIEHPTPDGRLSVCVLNASETPIYRLVPWIVLVEGAGPRSGEELAAVFKDPANLVSTELPHGILTVPPGRSTTTLSWGGGAMHSRPGVEIAFTDGAGRHWIRRASGKLESSSKDAVEHYGLPMPGVW